MVHDNSYEPPSNGNLFLKSSQKWGYLESRIKFGGLFCPKGRYVKFNRLSNNSNFDKVAIRRHLYISTFILSKFRLDQYIVSI